MDSSKILISAALFGVCVARLNAFECSRESNEETRQMWLERGRELQEALEPDCTRSRALRMDASPSLRLGKASS